MKTIIFTILIALMSCQAVSLTSPYLGVYIEDLTPAERTELKINEGVRVEDVVPNSPAQKSGIKKSDIILKIEKEPIKDSDHLVKVIRSYKNGSKIDIETLSDGKLKKRTVTLESRTRSLLPDINIVNTRTRHLGLKLQRLTEQLKRHFDVEYGALVAEVFSNSPAERAGVKAGDILLSVEGNEINYSYNLREAIKSKKSGETVTLVIKRGKDTLNLEAEIEESDSLLSIDLEDQLIILGKDTVIDISEISRLYNSIVTDSTKKEIEKQLENLQEELNRLRKRIKR